MAGELNKHVVRAADDIDRGVKLRNNYAIDTT